MSYDDAVNALLAEDNVELSTMMGTPCLRYKGEFLGMFFDKADAMIAKLPADRVNDLIASGEGLEFNYTKKRFKEWVLIPRERESLYEGYFREALNFSQAKMAKK